MPEPQKPSGLFRTPLACALLSGALAVAASTLLNNPQSYKWSNGNFPFKFLYLHTAIVYAIQLQAPAIYRRDLTPSVIAIAFAILLSISSNMSIQFSKYLMSYLPYFADNSRAVDRNYYIVNSCMKAFIQNSFLAVILVFLFQARKVMVRCFMIGAGITLLAGLLLFVGVNHYTWGGTATDFE
jgi:hypothetical protein